MELKKLIDYEERNNVRFCSSCRILSEENVPFEGLNLPNK